MASEKILLELARYFEYKNGKKIVVNDEWKEKFGKVIDDRCAELGLDEFSLLLDLIKRDAVDKFKSMILDEEMKTFKEFFVDRRSIFCEDI